jgi:hypothetical protein
LFPFLFGSTAKPSSKNSISVRSHQGNDGRQHCACLFLLVRCFNGAWAELKADTVRRVMMLSLDAGKEFPETRSFEINNLLQHISEHQGELLQAIYTIQLAHARAGYPEAERAQIGSFEEWGA